MNRDEIIRLAREAGYGWSLTDMHAPALERFAALVAAAEREACAQVVEDWHFFSEDPREVAKEIRDGWRQCAVGQGTTQFCAMVEEAVKAEREACAKVCDSIDTYGDRCEYWTEKAAKLIRARGQS